MARSVQRYLKTRNRAFQFEHVFLAFADMVAKSDNVVELQPLYVELNKQLTALENDPFEKSAFEYFDFPAWAESKATGKNLRMVIEEKAR